MAQNSYPVLEGWHIDLSELATKIITDKHQTREYTLYTVLLGIFSARMSVKVCM